MSERRDGKKPPGRLLFTDFDASSKGRRPSVSMSGGALPFFPAKSYPTLNELAADLDFSFEDDFDDDASASFPSPESPEDADSDSEERGADEDGEEAGLPADATLPESPPAEPTISPAYAFDHSGEDAPNEDVPDAENRAPEDDWLDRFDDFPDVAEPDILSLIPPEPLDAAEEDESRAAGRGFRRRRPDRPRPVVPSRIEPYGGIQRVENWYSPPEETDNGMHGHPEPLEDGGERRRTPSGSTRKYLATEGAAGDADATRNEAIADAESLFGELDMESFLHAGPDGESWSGSSESDPGDTPPAPDAEHRCASRDSVPDARMLFAPNASAVASSDAMNKILDAADFDDLDDLWAEDEATEPSSSSSDTTTDAAEHADAREKHPVSDNTDILPAEGSSGAIASKVGDSVADAEAEAETTRSAGAKRTGRPEETDAGGAEPSGAEPHESEDDDLADSLPDIVPDDASESADLDAAAQSPDDNDRQAVGEDMPAEPRPDGEADAPETSLDGAADDTEQDGAFGGGPAIAGDDGADAAGEAKAGESDGPTAQQEAAPALDPHDVFASMDAALFNDGGLDNDMKAMLEEDAAAESASPPEEEAAASGKADGQSRIRRRVHVAKTLADINAMFAWRDNWWFFCDLAAAIIAAASLAVILSYFLWYR